MGLRLLAHYYDRNEALIVSALLDSAGVTNFFEHHAQVTLQPFSEIALGGYRIMVCHEELFLALDVIEEARRNRSFEGERLVQEAHIVASLAVLFALGIPLPFRTSRWVSPEDPREEPMHKL